LSRLQIEVDSMDTENTQLDREQVAAVNPNETSNVSDANIVVTEVDERQSSDDSSITAYDFFLLNLYRINIYP
jgi:hypothetical protein